MARKLTTYLQPSILWLIENAMTEDMLRDVLNHAGLVLIGQHAHKKCDGPNPGLVRRWEKAAAARINFLRSANRPPIVFERVEGSPEDLLPINPELERFIAQRETPFADADAAAEAVNDNRHFACAELGVFHFFGPGGLLIDIADYFATRRETVT